MRNNIRCSSTKFLVFGESPIVRAPKWAEFASVRSEAAVLVLVVNGLDAVAENLATRLTGIPPQLPVHVLLVLVEDVGGHKSLATFVTRRPNAQVNPLDVFSKCKFTFADVSNELLATVFTHNFALGSSAGINLN